MRPDPARLGFNGVEPPDARNKASAAGWVAEDGTR